MKKSLKEAAKKNDKEVCLILAKEVLRARKAINRIHASKAQLNSVVMSMNHQLGNSMASALFHSLAALVIAASYPSFVSSDTSVGRLNAEEHRGYEEHAAAHQSSRSGANDARPFKGNDASECF